MKKTLLAALLSTMTITAIAADAKLIKLDVSVTKEGKTILQSSLETRDGQVVPLENTVDHAYRAQAIRGKEGKIYNTPGTIKTGFIASFNPSIQKDGNINAEVLIDVSELTAMKKITSSDGLIIDMPEVSKTHFGKKVIFTLNHPITLQSGDYTIKASAHSL